jgi:hypothetical protein
MLGMLEIDEKNHRFVMYANKGIMPGTPRCANEHEGA